MRLSALVLGLSFMFAACGGGQHSFVPLEGADGSAPDAAADSALPAADAGADTVTPGSDAGPAPLIDADTAVADAAVDANGA